jgi:hypothetical protein
LSLLPVGANKGYDDAEALHIRRFCQASPWLRPRR